MLKSASAAKSARVTFGKYKGTRHWAIWINEELIVVTVYRKGAKAVLKLLGLEENAVEIKCAKPSARWSGSYY
jgi:hypothetical protein